MIVVPANGKPRRLDRAAEPDENVSEEDLSKPKRVAEIFLRLLRDVATLKRRWWPRRIIYRDRTVDATGTTKYRFPHGFDGGVEWWISRPRSFSAAPRLTEHSDSDGNTLVLTSAVAGTVNVVIEEAG